MSTVTAHRARLGPHATRVTIASTAVLAIVVALLIGGAGDSGTYELRAQFDDVRGLIKGGKVRAGGIEVGAVRRVFLAANGYPEVVMRVDKDFRVHRGAVADLRLGSNAGVVNRVIELTQGDTAAPPLAEGATLTRAQTDQPVNFDEAVQTFNPQTRGDIRSFLARLDSATVGRAGDIAAGLENSSPALNETANLLAQVSEDGAALRTMVREGARAVSALASSPADVGAAVDRTAAVLRATAARHAELRATAAQLGPALVRARVLLGRLERATPSLQALIDGLRPLAVELGPIARLLRPLRTAAAPLARATKRLVQEAPRELRRLRPMLSAASEVSATVGPLAKSALPLAQSLRAYAPELAGAFQNFNALTGGYNGAGHVINAFLSFGPSPVSAARSIDGNDCGPGLLRRPYIRAPGAVECDPWTDYQDSFISAPAGGR